MISALLMGIAVMYLVLVVQFSSFTAPLPVMISLPLSLIGVVLALLFSGGSLNLMSLIGVIMLMGLVAKNAILLLDCTRKEEARGVEREQALMNAGRQRLRPILMTTFALIAGMLPVAIGMGEGGEFYRPMAVAIIGGTITSTLPDAAGGADLLRQHRAGARPGGGEVPASGRAAGRGAGLCADLRRGRAYAAVHSLPVPAREPGYIQRGCRALDTGSKSYEATHPAAARCGTDGFFRSQRSGAGVGDAQQPERAAAAGRSRRNTRPRAPADLGVEGYDEAISDFSRDDYEPMRADMQQGDRASCAPAPQRRPTSGCDRICRSCTQAAEDELTTARLDRKYFIPFYNLAGMVFGVVPRDHRSAHPRAEPAGAAGSTRQVHRRGEGLPAHSRNWRRNARWSASRPTRSCWVPLSTSSSKAILDSPTMLAGIRDLLASSKLPGWEPRYALLEKQLNDYNDWLKREMLPRARKDHRLPPEVYANNLRQYGVDISPEELISRALTSFAEIRNQMNITAGLLAKERGWPERDYRAVIKRLKADQLPADQVMPLYRSRLAQIEAIVREQKIVTLPDRAASIRLASPAENAQQPAPHMDPPRLIGNTGEYGEFVLTTGMSPDATGKALAFDDFSHPAVTWTLTAHEARPGHELQFARMIEAGVSIARAVFAFNSVNVEGWGLYAEAELQPYEPLDGQLIALQMRAHRAARAFLDPMVNLGQITPEQVKDFLMQEVVYSEGMATQEMQRYVFRVARTGHFVFLRLPAHHGNPPGGAARAARSLRPAGLQRLPAEPGTAAARPAATDRDGGFRRRQRHAVNAPRLVGATDLAP